MFRPILFLAIIRLDTIIGENYTTLFGLVFYGSENVADIQLRHELNYRHKNRTHKSNLHTLQMKMQMAS